MIRRNGTKSWKNIHATVNLTLEDLIDIDNSNAQGFSQTKYELLNQASKDINDLIKEARIKKKHIRAIGSGWALSHIQVTENWLLNTKLLNECFEVDKEAFHETYPEDKKQLLVIVQCGISIAELNVYLELPKNKNRIARSLKTVGIGAGQTIVGAVSGNTHGAAVNFGAIPDFVVAIQVCVGAEKPIWIERADYRVMNDVFIEKVNSKLLPDTNIFNSALVSFGAFGIITAYAIETEKIYHMKFPKIQEINLSKVTALFRDPSYYANIRHLEMVFNPYEDDTFYLVEGTQVIYEQGLPNPRPLWVITDKLGYSPGDLTTKLLLNLPLVSGKKKNQILFKEYLKNGLLSEVRGTSGQLFTATITYLEGYNETAFAVSINDIVETINIAKEATRELKLPLVFQTRTVHPGHAVFGFTNHSPRAIVFEFGISNDAKYPKFEELLINRLKAQNIKYTLHWSKNSLVDKARLMEMYGQAKIDTWKKSRATLFNNEKELMEIFNNPHLKQAGLDVS
ncbi:FAD-binding protein [Segetibacter aerophilus]|uniref:FAD-binding PCMH-type domain-containing protein n=1 Tax=Segetibacter aerophilus TaxID=670293 RepID=A0A512BFS0_9BACT|nr:FAD-binding protein [Segetibacter aerophilus]GEO10821.1 hypothetical protein SAE01_33170 [Segetibacter aerophilus]